MRVMNDWLGRRAQLSPERLALIDATRGGERCTYGAWEARANRTARLLAGELGVRKGDRVAVLAMNCAETLDLLFACAKLGAILQPLNWRLAPEELEACAQTTAPRVLAYGPDFAPQARALAGRVRSLERLVAYAPGPEDAAALPLSARDALPDAPLPGVALGPEAPWVLCPTGGSTGVPKAAILTHGSLTANAQNTVASWGLVPDDVALLTSPLFHTGGLNVFTTPLVYCGGTTVIRRGFQVDEVLEHVARRELTLFFGVPTMFIELQRHPRFAEVDWRHLRIVISGGAPCPEPVQRRFFELGVDLRNGYGLTEAGPNTFWMPTPWVREKAGAVGVPLWHIPLRIDGAPETGEAGPGELLIGGPQNFGGYWGKPEESARALEGGWLHTGDLATRDADGCYRIVGRSKDLIISGGENVYPAEVENVLAGHPSVAEVCVIGVPDEKWGECPRALVVLRPGAAPDADALVTHCRERLARYKCPRSVVFVDALARTGAGKVDRRALAVQHGRT